jgi:RNA polymerase sigma factor (sigma-70 family)
MAAGSLKRVIARLERAALAGDAGLSDGQLLHRYAAARDEHAFAALLRRHGGMVLGVCRRILGNDADAEDAFQATFLVLVRKAATIRTRALVGNWLYGVACNTARKAKAMNHKRRLREKNAAIEATAAACDEAWDETQAILDVEMSALPERYRTPLVLCDLEGMSIKAAASRLGWPEGTLASRLRRGRVLLARRLTGRGVTLSAAAALASAQGMTLAAAPPSLVRATLKAALLGKTAASGLISARVATLTQGVIKAMFMSKLKTALTVTLTLVLIGMGGSSLLWQATAGSGDDKSVAAAAGADQDNLKNTLLALDRHLWEAFARGDWQERRKFLADDLVSISILGKYGKAANVEADKRLRCAEWKIRDPEVVRISKDAAVLTYLYDCKILSKGGTLLETRRDVRATFAWANRKGGWVMVFCQDDHGKLVQDGSENKHYPFPFSPNKTDAGFPIYRSEIEAAEKAWSNANLRPGDDPTAPDAHRQLKGDLARLQGNWELVSEQPGNGSGRQRRLLMAIHGTDMVVVNRQTKEEAKSYLRIDLRVSPRAMDLMRGQANGSIATERAIYKLEGDRLTLCIGRPNGNRPKEFRAAETGPFPTLVEYRRVTGSADKVGP